MEEKFDFGGWATKNDLLCSDGRIIRKDAFANNDGCKVPLVWNHDHNQPENVLGHALLQNRPEGVYAYGKFNDSESGKTAKILVESGDIASLSIYANGLKQNGNNVMHGNIRELSLVLAGANPGARIDSVIYHGDELGEEAELWMTDELTEMVHGEIDFMKDEVMENNQDEILEHAEKAEGAENTNTSEETESEETVADVIETMNEKQQTVLYALIGEALENGSSADKTDGENTSEEGKDMKHNVFENEAGGETMTGNGVLSHSEMSGIIEYAKSNRFSLKRAITDFASENEHLAHGVDDIEMLFPDYRDIRPGAPEMITRDLTWIDGVINGVNKVPFQRIRTRQADVRGKDLRAFGYQKGKFKKQPGNIKLMQRTTDPQTIYRKDSLHRDDILDITDFDVVEWQYQVMRQNLNEDLALAIMIGDGREDGDEMKIEEEHIRPIWTDDDLYTIHYDVDIEQAKQDLQGENTSQFFSENYIYAEAIIKAALYSREQYKGSGALEFYCTPHLLNVMLLARDLNGRRIYDSVSDLASALNVTRIQTAEQFEGQVRDTADSKKKKLLGLFVNLKDYSVGHVRGGEITRFNQFDIDFNQEKYLIETRLSGALTRVYSAIALEEDVTA